MAGVPTRTTPSNGLLELGKDFADDLNDRMARIVDLPEWFTALALGTDTKGRISVAINDLDRGQ